MSGNDPDVTGLEVFEIVNERYPNCGTFKCALFPPGYFGQGSSTRKVIEEINRRNLTRLTVQVAKAIRRDSRCIGKDAVCICASSLGGYGLWAWVMDNGVVRDHHISEEWEPHCQFAAVVSKTPLE